MDASAQEITEEPIDEIMELEWRKLIEITIEIGNTLTGKKLISGNENLIFAEGLGQKLIRHVVSAYYLFKGYQLGTPQGILKPIVEFSSDIYINSGALETYLTLNYIYISPKSHSEQEFRFLCWDYAGCEERSDFYAKSEVNIKNKESEKEIMRKLQKDIESHDYFQRIHEYHKKNLLEKGAWRLGRGWSNLALDAGINEKYFNDIYKYLCGYSHSSRLSILQIQEVKEVEAQKMQTRMVIPLFFILLAKYNYDYVNLMPGLKEVVDLDSSKYQSIIFWRKYGEICDPRIDPDKLFSVQKDK